MLTLKIEIEKHIKKLVNPLKEEDDLQEALKLKLTKKELKLLKAWAYKANLDELKSQLNLDDKHYEELSLKLIKKLNQEKTKQAICI